MKTSLLQMGSACHPPLGIAGGLSSRLRQIGGGRLRRIGSLLLLCVFLFSPKEGRSDGEPGAARSGAEGASASQPREDVCLQDLDCARLANRARSMSAAHEYAAALLAYQAAYAMRPAPWLLVNIGRVNQKLGRLKEAIQSYREFLARDGQPEESDTRSRAKAFLAAAEAELARQPPPPTAAEEPEPPPAPLVEPPPRPSATPPEAAPARAAATPALGRVTAQSDTQRPVYKRPWFIGLVSASAAGVVLLGLAFGISASPRFERPNMTLYPTKP